MFFTPHYRIFDADPAAVERAQGIPPVPAVFLEFEIAWNIPAPHRRAEQTEE
jgi:hypothetical protein